MSPEQPPAPPLAPHPSQPLTQLPWQLQQQLEIVRRDALPLPGAGNTPRRHQRLFATGREDLSLAKLAEAHWDALAILAEAGRDPAPGALYAVWASETPGNPLRLEPAGDSYRLTGSKGFSTGAGIVDRALITVGDPEQRLVELDLRRNVAAVVFDGSAWKTEAFRLTATGAVTFNDVEVAENDLVGGPGFYLRRPGFWHGALGPAACWAGGVAGLLDEAMRSSRDDPHTLAHLAAVHSNIWAMQSILDTAGREIDADPSDRHAAQIRALTVRHLVEQAATDTLRRFARAYGPSPLSMNADVSRRYHEADLYLRQCHGERDLEALARALRTL